MKLLIKNVNILQFYPSKVEYGKNILIENDKIIKIFDVSIENSVAVDKIIDAKGKFIIPGIVCSHNHFYSALARGIKANIKPSYDFVGILQNLWWKLDFELDKDSLYYSGIVGAIESVKSGTTSVIDHNASPSFIRNSLNTLKEGFEKVGLRGILCYEVTDRNGEKQAEEGVEENVDFIKNHETNLIKGTVGAHAPFTLSDRTMHLLEEAVKDTKRGIHIHVCEDRYDMSYSHHFYKQSTIQRLEKFNIINKYSLIVHGVHLLDKDIDIINKHDSFLIHNPRSNMNNNVGYNHKLDKYKNVALGTDGIGANMFEETKIGYFKARDYGLSYFPEKYMEYLYNGNKILKRYFDKNFGEIEEGYIADLVILDYDPPTPVDSENIAGHFIFGISSRDVDSVIINGKVVYESRRFPFDVKEIYKKASIEAKKLWERMG